MIFGPVSYAFLSTLLGLVYPTYCSLWALRTEKKEDDVQWLMYWVVYAAFKTVEIAPDFIFAGWLPLYFELKLAFLLWLIMPKFEGAKLLYLKYGEPWLVEN